MSKATTNQHKASVLGSCETRRTMGMVIDNRIGRQNKHTLALGPIILSIF